MNEALQTRLEQRRDELAKTLDLSDFGPLAEAGYRTAFPYTAIEQAAMPALPADEMGRVIVRPAEEAAVSAERWTATVDRLTGLHIQMRRADCGAGCRCATEVRISETLS